MSSRVLFIVACVCLVGCSRKSSPEPSGAASSAPTTASPGSPITSVPAAADSPPAAAAPPAEPEGTGPPKQVVEAEGIKIRELADGRVEVRGTSQWNEPIDQTFADCTYFRKAVSVLERQLGPERAKLLGRVCKGK